MSKKRVKAGLLDYVTALFDPNTGVNSEGYLVKQNGYFDNVKDSTDYDYQSDILRYYPSGTIEDVPEVTTTDPVTSATNITSSNNAAGQDAVNSANNVNQQTTNDAFNKYMQSIDYLNTSNISSAEKIMQMNEQAQINAYNRNLSYLDEYYPRLIKSLRNAGINPVLMATRGFGSPNYTSSASQISSPYITLPSQLSGFSSQVAQLDFNTMRDVLTQVLGDQTDLKQTEIYAAATVLSSLMTALTKAGLVAAGG